MSQVGRTRYFVRSATRARSARQGEEKNKALFFSSPRLALHAKYRVRPAWLIKRLSCRLQKLRFEIPRDQCNGTFRLHIPDPSHRAFGYCSCKQDMKERYWGQQFCQMERDISVRPTEVTRPVKVDHLERWSQMDRIEMVRSIWFLTEISGILGWAPWGFRGMRSFPRKMMKFWVLGYAVWGIATGNSKVFCSEIQKKLFHLAVGAVIDCKPNKRGCKCVQRKVASVLGFLAPCFRCTWQFQLRGVRPKLDFCHYVVGGGGEVLFTIFFDRGSPAPFLTVPMVGFLSYASYIAIKLWFSNCTVGSYV